MFERLKGLLSTSRKFVVVACFFGGLVVLAFSLVAFLPARGYLVDQLSQLRLLYMVLSLPLLLVFFVLRARDIGLVACGCLLVNAAACVPLFLPDPSAATEDRLNVLSANIWGVRNHNYDKLISLVHERRPDVICLEEVTRSWLDVLHRRLPDYPYSLDEGGRGGSAIFSRLPIEKVANVSTRYGIQGQLQWNGKTVIMVAEHPPAPVLMNTWRRRNEEFARLSHDVGASSVPKVLAGDFNSTPWSWYFQKLISDGRLKDSESGRGIQPTWCTWMPLPLVPIDHCLYTDQFTTIKREIGPNIGSDHLPLLVQLSLRKTRS